MGVPVMRYTVAAVQFEPRLGDKPFNVERLMQLTTEAARAGARLVVLPEMATTGYRFKDRAEIAPLVEQVPDGPTVKAFADLAARLNIHVVVGLAEVEPATGAYYNTAALVGPRGYIGQYRKTHSYVDETRWARDGDLGIPVFDTELGRIAMLICMDIDYPEPSRVAALAGADVIAFPTNWENHQTAWRVRALENGVYMVCANRWGEERGTRFCGHSTVIDPQGMAQNLLSSGDGVVLAEVDTDMARRARAGALARRRPDQYHDLLLSSYLWHWAEGKRLAPGRPVVIAAGEADTAEHMADLVRWADKQARDREWPKLDLAVFPFTLSEVDPAPLAEVARALECHVVWGGVEPEGYHTVWLMGPDGLVGRYRQVHPEPAVRPGADGFAVFDLPWGRLGLLLGPELLVPEAARVLAKQGADVIAVPARWPEGYDRLLWGARSEENDTAVVVANRLGGSAIHAPGHPHTVNTDGTVALALVDTSAPAIRCKELLRKLQTRWYDSLVSR